MLTPNQEARLGKARFENLATQPLITHPVFNNSEVLTEGWYPVISSKKLKKKKAYSFKLLSQRVAIYRTELGNVYALDAFCPHMGADLANGIVKKEKLSCYFHRWEFDKEGKLSSIPCQKKAQLKNVKTTAWPTQEKYGYIWIYTGETPSHFVTHPAGLENQKVSALFIKEVTLFAHHHILMASGIDIQHFASVHNLDIDFQYQAQETEPNVYEWTLSGKIPKKGFKARFGRFLLGDTFTYKVKFAGGSLTTITYGWKQKFLGRWFEIPSLNILWGATPQENGISRVKIFLVTKERKGLRGKIINFSLYLSTLLLLSILKDEDIKAFPNIRFNANHLIKSDESVSRLIQMINRLPLAKWSVQKQSKSLYQ
jgi:phenylpropionate dioxygenase-like ring-hydroxylating dioxygenase large terminal subunit